MRGLATGTGADYLRRRSFGFVGKLSEKRSPRNDAARIQRRRRTVSKAFEFRICLVLHVGVMVHAACRYKQRKPFSSDTEHLQMLSDFRCNKSLLSVAMGPHFGSKNCQNPSPLFVIRKHTAQITGR